LSPALQESLVAIFTDTVMERAQVPAARRPDVLAAPIFSADSGEIWCTCGITGSTYSEPWSGSSDDAKAFAEAVGESTAGLVKRTKKGHLYAWLYAGR
jgi:hypothetical protein